MCNQKLSISDASPIVNWFYVFRERGENSYLLQTSGFLYFFWNIFELFLNLQKSYEVSLPYLFDSQIVRNSDGFHEKIGERDLLFHMRISW